MQMIRIKTSFAVNPVRRTLLAVAALFSIATTHPASAQGDVVFSDGANTLFIGHSFFVPVAVSFDRLAKQNGYSEHEYASVFASGARGSAGAMWDNEELRARVEEILATGTVELFGLTAYGSLGSSFTDYQQWIDLALEYNPDTRFFVGSSWTPGGPVVDTASYDEAIETAGETLFATVEQLRAAYPGTEIYFQNFGKTASTMKRLFEAGELVDVSILYPGAEGGNTQTTSGSCDRIGVNNEFLFLDGTIGHGGPMMLDMSAVAWLELFYGADVTSLLLPDYNEPNVTDITTEVLTYNEQYK